jgi:predicted DNA-binding protein (UPF0251 family)
MSNLAQNETHRNNQSLAARSIAKEHRVCARSSPEGITAQRASAKDSLRPHTLEEIRRVQIWRVLDACEGNRFRAAQLLGIGRTTLYRFLKRSEKKLGGASTDPEINRIIEILTVDMHRFENDAKRIDAMLSTLPAPERHAWKETAKDYRKRSAKYSAEIEAIKAEQPTDFIKPGPASAIR